MSEPSPSVDYIHQDAFAARLRHAVAVFGGANALAKAIGRSDGAMRKWLRGESEPSVSDLRAICRVSGASVDWLVTGRGDSRLIAGVREPTATYGRAPLDDDLLEHIMMAVDAETHARGVEITSTKRSGLVAALYGLSSASGIVDAAVVARLVKLAA